MHPAGRLAAALASGPPLIGDAAMGTRLIARGLDLARDDPALGNLSRPGDVLDLHRRDIEAGSDVLATNTFGANRPWLARFGRAGDFPAIQREAVALAREAAGPHRFVLGTIGPGAAEGGPAAYAEQAEMLMALGVDGLLLETHRWDQAEIALVAFASIRSGPLLISLYEWPDPAGPVIDRLRDLGAEALGANCGTGPASVVAAIERLAPSGDIPLIASPTAGLPGGPMTSPAEFAAIAAKLVAQGVRLIGGCCGTTEAHIRAIRSALAAPA